ncbi:MAG: excinuclease ABC subunit UvrC [Candidatus Nomurabacteria bacterium]|jgi:excinuclease ABC subunit C|nr:excinuclease ABC subunit UvrC [Candidatus Nomurabacteria bacterium]
MNQKLKAKLKELPNTPGVYFHKDANGGVIYVGKAANLRNRVRSYFNREHGDAKTRALVAEIVDTDWLEVETELDALFLESEMVKRYMPKWNILLRDDKSHTYVRIDMKSEWPVVSYTHDPLDDGAEYFGPYYGGSPIKQAMRQLRRVFPYYVREPSPKRSRLEAQLGLEPVEQSSAEYKAGLRKLIRVIKGERVGVLRELEREMKVAALAQDFEQAAVLRNQVNNLKALQKQILFGDKEFLDISKDQALVELRDVLGLKKLPARIEGFDISHQGGRNVVASMVVFKNGASSRADYRKFKLSRQCNDDTANMREVVTRRLRHLEDWGKPDLVIIDGGVGQLGAVADLLQDKKIPFVGRSKSGNHTRNATTQILAPSAEGYYPLSIAHDSHLVKLIARIDEESHRFAISYHTVLKRQAGTRSVLDDIPGIGPKTKVKLLKKYGSVAKIKQASEAELTAIVGLDKAKIISSTLGK